MENRARHIDIVRTIAIILVVFGHIGPVPGRGWLEVHFPMYAYRMALFLFVSGYLFRDMDRSAFPAFCKKKNATALMPFYRVEHSLCRDRHAFQSLALGPLPPAYRTGLDGV